MSGLMRASEKMKKKISFGDYAVPIQELPLSEEVGEKDRQVGRKIYSLAKEDSAMLQKIFTKRLHSSSQSSICEIMSEAILLLYNQEFAD